MRYSNKQEVAKAWVCGQRRKAGNFQTDGNTLFSYDLVVGETRGLTKVLYDYTSKGSHGFRSMTTSGHVNAAKPFADVVE